MESFIGNFNDLGFQRLNRVQIIQTVWEAFQMLRFVRRDSGPYYSKF